MKRALLAIPLAMPLLLLAPGASDPSFCDGYGYVISGAELNRFDSNDGSLTPVIDLPESVNAVGVRGEEIFGIARPVTRAVAFTKDGTMRELGPIAGAPSQFAGAFVGTISGDDWLLLYDDRVYTVDLDTRAVTASVPIASVLDIGDWAAGAGGDLISVSTTGGVARVVRILPGTGAVQVLGVPAGLPGTSLYGGVWIQDDQLFALHHTTGRLYRVDLASPDEATLVGTYAPSTGVDAFACDPQPVPPSPSPSAPVVQPSLSPGPVETPPAVAPSFASPPVASPPAPPPAPPPAATPGVTSDTVVPPAIVRPAPPAPPQANRPAPPRVNPPPPPPRSAPPRRPAPTPPAATEPVEIIGQPLRVPDAGDQNEKRRWIAAGAGAMMLGLLALLRGGGSGRAQ